MDPVTTAALAKKIVTEVDGPPAPDGPADVVAALTGLDQETAEFLTRASGGELRSLLTADLRFLRLKRALKVARKAQSLLEASGRAAAAGDMNVVIPLLEAASLQEDDELIERWAGLLANATDPAGSPVEPGFPDVLRQLSQVDARLFDYIVLRGHQVVHDRWYLRPLHRGEIKHAGPVNDDDAFSVALENLLRVRLVVEVPMLKEKRRDGGIGLTFDDQRIKLSSYGAKFAKAVHRGGAEQEPEGPPAQTD